MYRDLSTQCVLFDLGETEKDVFQWPLGTRMESIIQYSLYVLRFGSKNVILPSPA